MSKLGLSWDPFVFKQKHELKFTEDLFVLSLKNNKKFEEKLT